MEYTITTGNNKNHHCTRRRAFERIYKLKRGATLWSQWMGVYVGSRCPVPSCRPIPNLFIPICKILGNEFGIPQKLILP